MANSSEGHSRRDFLGRVERRAIFLVYDFALGHAAPRLARKIDQPPEEAHRALPAGLVPGAYAVPSGIFGSARAQNAGCAFLNGNG